MTLEVVRDQEAVAHFLRGTTLANGALCIAAVPTKFEGEFVVLAFRNQARDPYVVWTANSEGECWRGDYCDSLEDAMQCFERRAGVRP